MKTRAGCQYSLSDLTSTFGVNFPVVITCLQIFLSNSCQSIVVSCPSQDLGLKTSILTHDDRCHLQIMFSMYHDHKRKDSYIKDELPAIRDNLVRLCHSW